MVDMMALLKAPMSEAKKPSALPVGVYKGVIKGREFGESAGKKTPYVRFNLGLTDWPEELDEDEKSEFGKPIDLAKRSLRIDFYLTDTALWRLVEFVKSCGIVVTEAGGETYEEGIEDLLGMPVFVDVGFYTSKNGDIGNEAKKIWGEAEG